MEGVFFSITKSYSDTARCYVVYNCLNLNESVYLVNAWSRLVNAINNSDTIGAAIVKAQQLNDKEYESKN